MKPLPCSRDVKRVSNGSGSEPPLEAPAGPRCCRIYRRRTLWRWEGKISRELIGGIRCVDLWLPAPPPAGTEVAPLRPGCGCAAAEGPPLQRGPHRRGNKTNVFPRKQENCSRASNPVADTPLLPAAAPPHHLTPPFSRLRAGADVGGPWGPGGQAQQRR